MAIERLEDRSLPSAALPTFDNLQVDASKYDPQHVLVAFQNTTNASSGTISNAIVKTDAPLDLGGGLYRFDLQTGVSVGQAIAYFGHLGGVRYAQPDYQVSLALTPNDAYFRSQWGLQNTGAAGGTAVAGVSAAQAWNITTGTGRTIVAVIDTGVDITHPDLAANIWTNTREIAGNGRDDDGNGFVDDVHGWNFAGNNNNVMDDNGHGTHVAGVIAAAGNNGIGVAGLDWHAQIMPLKFLGAGGTGDLSNAIRALNYAVAHGATVSNNSYSGGGYYYGAFSDAIKNAQAHGHIFVAAAGNNSASNDVSPNYPASYTLDNIISVAATDSNDRLASFSNWGGRSVSLGAPGVNIYSTYHNGGYAYMSGTSMAAPFVTGTIALLHDRHPDWSYRQLVQQIMTTTDPLPALQGKTVSGGRLDVYRALASGLADTAGPRVTAANFAGPTATSLNRLRVTFNKPIDPLTFTAGDIVSFTRNGQAVSGVAFTVAAVAGTNNQFDIGFTTQTLAGTYALTIGPVIRDLAGNPMNQNGNGTNGETAGDRYTATAAIAGSLTFNSSGPAVAIPDRSRVTSTIVIGQDVTIGQLSVRLNIKHTSDGNLRVTLKSPWGASIVLVNQRGGSGQDFRTVFDDRAATSIIKGQAPFVGWFKPEQPLATFGGRNARGTWSLTVEDLTAGNTGSLTGWSIVIEPTAGSAGHASTATVPAFWSAPPAPEPMPAPQYAPVFTARSMRPPLAMEPPQPLAHGLADSGQSSSTNSPTHRDMFTELLDDDAPSSLGGFRIG